MDVTHQPAGFVPQMAEEQGKLMHLVLIQDFSTQSESGRVSTKINKTQITVTKPPWPSKLLSVLDFATSR